MSTIEVRNIVYFFDLKLNCSNLFLIFVIRFLRIEKILFFKNIYAFYKSLFLNYILEIIFLKKDITIFIEQ